jgi:DNA-binding MarR family transcriptional regulator
LSARRRSAADDGECTVDDVASIGPFETGLVLDSASSRAGFTLTMLGDLFSRHVREVLGGHDLKPRQLRILDLLDDRGPVGQRELADLVGVDNSVLVNLLNPLEAARLIKRKRDTVDRRRHLVSIVAAGQRRLAQADQAFRDVEDAFFAPLSDDERVLLHALLSRLRDAAPRLADHDC